MLIDDNDYDDYDENEKPKSFDKIDSFTQSFHLNKLFFDLFRVSLCFVFRFICFIQSILVIVVVDVVTFHSINNSLGYAIIANIDGD